MLYELGKARKEGSLRCFMVTKKTNLFLDILGRAGNPSFLLLYLQYPHYLEGNLAKAWSHIWQLFRILRC